MTREEFLNFKNPDEKSHDSDSYDFDLAKLNQTLHSKAFTNLQGVEWMLHIPYGGGEGYVVTKDGTTVAVVHQDTLYHGNQVRPNDVPKWYGRDEHITWSKTKLVKYPQEYVPLVSNIAKRNRAEYPHLLQNIRVRGEPYQVRSAGPPVPNKGTALAILNTKGEVVAEGQNEWGATLLVVAREYRSRGLGKIIGQYWYHWNPTWTSGGFTPEGENNALRLWETRVREFSENGWYSELVRQKRLTMDRVREILGGLSGKKPRPTLPESASPEPKKTILFFVEDSALVVYDSTFLVDQDAKYIHGHGFLRDNTHVGTFLYTLDYDRPFHKLVTEAALQMAKDQGKNLYVGPGYGDVLEIEGIEGVERTGNHITLTKDLLPLRQLSVVERRTRKKADPFGETQSLLLEMAESKW